MKLDKYNLPALTVSNLKKIIFDKLEVDDITSVFQEKRCWGLESEGNVNKYLKNFLDQSMKRAAIYYGTKNLRFTLMGNIVPPGIDIGSGGGWHCDSRFSKQIKFFIYLSDVNHKADGAFEYFPSIFSALIIFKSIFRGNLGSRFFDMDISNLYKYSKCVIGKKGSIFFSDTRLVHRGHPVENNRSARIAITLYVYGKKFPKDLALTLWNTK